MRILFLSILVLLTSIIDASAKVRWEGEMIITASSGTCPDYDPTGGFYIVRYRPSGLSDNGPNTTISIFQTGHPYVQSFRLNNGRFTTALQKVDTMSVGDGFGAFDDPVYVKFASSTPATITATTKTIVIAGQIKGFDYMPACLVTFNLVLLLRPN